MKLIVVNQFGKGLIVNALAIPRKGDQVDMFYKPNPRVTEVVMWPSEKTLRELQAEGLEIEAVVMVA